MDGIEEVGLGYLAERTAMGGESMIATNTRKYFVYVLHEDEVLVCRYLVVYLLASLMNECI